MKCFLIGLLSVLILSACDNFDLHKTDPNQNPVEVGPNWSINDVSVTCENEALCPDNQGILLVIKCYNEYSYLRTIAHLLVYRCTGTVYDIDKVVTAGHCIDDFAGASEIWFKTVNKAGMPARTFKVSSVSIAKQSPPDSDLNRIDYGAFRLEGQASGIAFGHPALTIPTDMRELIALVINPKPTSKEIATDFILNAVPCRHGANMMDPITYDQNPDKFLFTDCKIYGGNSGGAVVSRQDPLSILGLISTSNLADHAKPSSTISPSAVLMNAGEDDNSPITEHGTATNARCFSMPGWPKMEAKCIEISRAAIQRARAEIRKHMLKKSMFTVTQKWFSDGNSEKVLATTGVHFFPMVATVMTQKSILEDIKPEGLALLPTPICVTQDLASDVDTVVYPVSYTFEDESQRSLNLTAKPLITDLSFRVSIHRELNGQYTFRYVATKFWDRSGAPRRYLSAEDADYKKLTSTFGLTRELSKCDGNEDTVFLKGLDDFNRKNP